MKITQKLAKSAFILAAAVLSGCITPQMAKHDEENARAYYARQSFEGRATHGNRGVQVGENWLMGGPLYNALGRQLERRGQYNAANGAYMISESQRMQFDRNTAVTAAQEARTQVTINMPEESALERQDFPNGKTLYSFAFTDYVDNGDGQISMDEFQGVSKSYSLSNIKNLNVMTRTGAFKGCYPRVWVMDRFGNTVLTEIGQKIENDLAIVQISASNLRNSIQEPDSWYTVRFEMLDSNQQRIGAGKTVDDYQLKLIK